MNKKLKKVLIIAGSSVLALVLVLGIAVPKLMTRCDFEAFYYEIGENL